MIRVAYGRADSWDLDREWLDTDGRGGYASATPSGCHTRRYHGLLVANLAAPEGRHLLLAKLEDSLLAGAEETFFTCHRYPGCLFPPGPPPLSEFRLALHPCFRYEAGAWTVEKSVLLIRERDTLLIRYDFRGQAREALLRLKPFLAFRGYHALAHENRQLDGRAESIDGGFRITPYAGLPPLYLQTSAPSRFLPSPLWYNHFEYLEERERGFEWQEDLFLPGIIEVSCRAEGSVFLCASCGPPPGEGPASLWDGEMARRRAERADDARRVAVFLSAGRTAPAPAPGQHTPKPEGRPADAAAASPGAAATDGSPWPAAEAVVPGGDGCAEDRGLLLALLAAGRQFLIRTPSGRPAIIAGYPWFGSWGRDTLLSLPGLAFCCGRIREGVEILTEIGRHEREGILPNFFSADGTPEAYNTVDSSLLYFWTVQEFLRLTADRELVRSRFWPVMKRILDCFIAGTHFGIGMDARGLLQAGDDRTALTWMDATVGEIPVTPRHGFAVEINALWYNAVCLACDLAAQFKDPDWRRGDLAALIGRSFQATFWNPAAECLGDVARAGVLDTAIRPNQLFAVSLPFSPLTADQQRAVVATVREQLLTPCGLRTLSPAHRDYRGHYRGNGAERDGAYHQGTVWPWLLGPFGEAALRVAADREREKQFLLGHLRRFLKRHLGEAGIGSVSEVFDGDAPHRPGGCIAQAWSVAELIRLYALLGQSFD